MPDGLPEDDLLNVPPQDDDENMRTNVQTAQRAEQSPIKKQNTEKVDFEGSDEEGDKEEEDQAEEAEDRKDEEEDQEEMEGGGASAPAKSSKKEKQVADPGMEIPVKDAKTIRLGHDEQYLIICMSNGDIRIWDLNVQDLLLEGEQIQPDDYKIKDSIKPMTMFLNGKHLLVTINQVK